MKEKSLPFKHVPVLLEEVLEWIKVEGEGIYVDGTVGMGGHSEAILENTSQDDRLYGFEWNEDSFLIAKKRLARFGDRVRLYQKNFTEIADTLCEDGEVAKAVLLDLGLSSFLLEDSERGFTFQKDEPLDMRMSYSYSQLTAKDILNRYDFLSLEKVFSYGEVPAPKKFAKFILEKRKKKPFETTGDLVQAVKEFFRPGKKEKDFLAVVFQALRIEVNQELQNLEKALETIPQVLKKGGRFLVISFHSLEDRLVKRAFKADPRLKPLLRKPIVPSEKETRQNPRSRSAKLRVAERI